MSAVIRRWSCMLLFFALVYKHSFKASGANLCTPPCLLVSNTSDIVAIDYKTAAVTPVVTGLSRAVAIDIHFSLGYIFWSDVTDLNIKRFRIDVASTTTIISSIGVCGGLAVDWRASQLYWTDETSDTISMSDLEGNIQGTLISSGLHTPRDIALDPDNGLMIWTDVGTHPKIEKASLSGNQRVAVVTAYLYLPNGIELDKGSKRIFWVDAIYDRVETVDYSGNTRKILFQLDGLHPFGVVLVAPFLFFTDWNTYREAHKLDATTGQLLRSYSINGGRPMGIVAYDSARQPSASNLCAVNNGGCSHFCVTKASGYECVCPTGLAVKQDGKTCEDIVRKFILYADADDKSTNFISLDVNYFISQPFFNHLGDQRPFALDFDPVEDRVYWSDVFHGRILSAFSNATSLKTLFHCNVKKPDGLAIDHVGRNIYWTDTGTNRIEVGRLDGTRRRVLIRDGLDEPRAIVLYEKKGKMYWTDWGANPKIEQAEMDGSARQTIVTGNLAWPSGLTIDQATNRLFWADAKLDKIEASDLTGGNRQLIVSSSADIHPYGLAVHEDMLYWTDWNTKSISRFNLSSGIQEEIVNGLQKPTDIHVFDPSLIFSGPHNCSLNNGLCSDFCLLKTVGYQCACPTGVALKSDGKNCDYEIFNKASSAKFMIIAEAHVGKIYKVPLEVPDTPCSPLGINTNISRPVAVDYDPVEGKIYWTDVSKKLLARAFPNGSSVEVIVKNNVDTPDGLALDYVGRNIYWTDMGTKKIEVARLDGSFRRSLVITNIQHPRAIILDIAERKMYWSDWGSSPKIEKANMDGSARTTLVSSVLIWVNSLAMDYQNRLLYWCDAGLDTIERVDLQGNNRVLILDLSLDSTHPFGLALFGDALFWSDWHNQSVHSYNMTTSRKEVVFRGMGEPMDLHIYDQAKDFFGSTSCSQLNGGCSHLCLPNTHGHQCFCPEGVQLKPGDNYTCQGVNRCPQLSAPAHGSLAPCANLPGHYCHFSCDSGYTLAGSATRTCHNNGVWTGTQPQCNALSCASLTTPQNAILLTISCGITIGSNCVFGCQDGYGSSQGNVTRTCLQTGQWSGDPISCTAHSCGPVNIPPGATLLTASCGNTYGSSCVLGCQSDNFTTTCLQSGQWSGNPINCTDNSPPSFNNTCPDNMVFYATECSSSALLTWIEPKATDNSDRVSIIYPAIRPPVNLTIGLYNVLYSAIDSNGNQANCTFIVQVARKSCPVLQPPVYGSISSLSCGAAFGSQASLACNKGYRMAGAPLRSCRADGIWSGNVTSCNIVKCPQITTPPHGMVFPSACQIPSGVNYKTECFFVCNVTVGFQLEGASKVSCLESGSWSEDTSKTICRDTQAPSITCPPDMDNIPTEPGKSYADVKWQLPVLNDNSNKNLTLTGSRPPLKLDVGKKHITYKVTDSSGLSRSCIFFIHVKDLEPPKIANCPDGIYKTSEEKWTKIFFPGVTVTDNVGVHLLTTDRQNGSMFTWGEHNVTYTASDIAGNTAKCHFQVIIVAKSCDELRTPQNGAKACDKWLDAGTFCTLHCNVGYDFVNRPPEMYICGASGKWVQGNTVPDCSKTRPAQTLLALEYHYLSDKCTEEIHDSIAGNFIALYTTYLGTVGGCDENEECTIENVGVECGDQSGTLRRRDIADSEQASKVPLTVKFALKVPLPSNTSVVGLNEATQQISSNILASLSEADLTLNVSGVILQYDSSKPPVVRTVGLVCDKGQVLKGTHCVNCPVGYFFSSTGCQACAEDNYQDNEAQIECVTCPSGTSTFGQTGSKGNEDCQEIRSSSSTGKQGMPAKILYPVIALVSVLVIAVTVFAIYCLRKRRRDNRRPTVNARTQNHGMSENVQHDNPTYGQASSEPEYMEIDSYERPVPQPDVGFRNPHFDPGDHYQTLDNANERPDHTYGRLDITGVRSQSYV